MAPPVVFTTQPQGLRSELSQTPQSEIPPDELAVEFGLPFTDAMAQGRFASDVLRQPFPASHHQHTSDHQDDVDRPDLLAVTLESWTCVTAACHISPTDSVPPSPYPIVRHELQFDEIVVQDGSAHSQADADNQSVEQFRTTPQITAGVAAETLPGNSTPLRDPLFKHGPEIDQISVQDEPALRESVAEVNDEPAHATADNNNQSVERVRATPQTTAGLAAETLPGNSTPFSDRSPHPAPEDQIASPSAQHKILPSDNPDLVRPLPAQTALQQRNHDGIAATSATPASRSDGQADESHALPHDPSQSEPEVTPDLTVTDKLPLPKPALPVTPAMQTAHIETSVLEGQTAERPPGRPEAVTSETRPVVLDHNPIIRQLVDLRILTRGETVEIRLWPEELGRVRIFMTGQDAAPHLIISAERPEVFEQIRRHGDALLQALQDEGLADATLGFRDKRHAHADDGHWKFPDDDGLADDRISPDTAPAQQIVRRTVSASNTQRIDIRA